jgi:hypothetical protein
LSSTRVPYAEERETVPNKLKSIVVVEERDKRYILKTFSDGSEEHEPVVKLPRNKRYLPRPESERGYRERDGRREDRGPYFLLRTRNRLGVHLRSDDHGKFTY